MTQKEVNKQEKPTLLKAYKEDKEAVDVFLKFVMDLKKVILNKDKEALHGELIPTINKMY